MVPCTNIHFWKVGQLSFRFSSAFKHLCSHLTVLVYANVSASNSGTLKLCNKSNSFGILKSKAKLKLHPITTWMLCQGQNKHMQFALRLRKNPHHLFLLALGASRVQSQVLAELLTACWWKHTLLTQETRWTVVFWGKGPKKLLIFSFAKHLLWFLALKAALLSHRGRFRVLDQETGKK